LTRATNLLIAGAMCHAPVQLAKTVAIIAIIVALRHINQTAS